MAEYLLEYALDSEIQVAYLSRGYGRNSKGFRYVNPSIDRAVEVGDEALQVAHKFPKAIVAVCEKRKTGIERLRQDHALQLVILDDAFQHRHLGRTMDIVLIDANRPPQSDFLLPAGNLREPIQSLDRADVIVITKIQTSHDSSSIRKQYQKWKKPLFLCNIVSKGLFTFSNTDERFPLSTLSGKKVLLFSGIGNHDAFRIEVEKEGGQVIKHIQFRDHYSFKTSDIQHIIHLYEEGLEEEKGIILTTEKDFYRMKGMENWEHILTYPFYFLSIKIGWLENREVDFKAILANAIP